MTRNNMAYNSIQSESDIPIDEIVIEFLHVNKTFINAKYKSKIAALQDVNFIARKGKITGLIGPDGAGKTTIMRMIAGLMVPDSGEIKILRKDVVKELHQVQSEIGYMPQHFGLYEDLTTGENLDLYADLQGVLKSDREKHYKELMQMTNLGSFTNRLAGKLSGGMKQKLGLACALIRFPHLLILDEPTVGVDPLSRRELWSIINRLVKDEGMSVIISTAYLDEAEKCDDIVLIHNGNILDKGSPDYFKNKVNGRTYIVNVAGMAKRSIEEKFAQHENILDSIIQGDNIRLVTLNNSPPDIQDEISESGNLSIKPVSSRFEDSFISILNDYQTASEDDGHSDFKMYKSKKRSDSKENVIQVHNLTRRFGAFYAVNGITFEVKKGEIFGLLGANGAGKSTTFRMLCGLLPISSGDLNVAGVDLRKASAKARRQIGYMSQKFSLYGDLSVRQNLKFFSSAYGLTSKMRSERIEWAIEQFNLGSKSEVNSISLPLGYKRRLAMACSLMHDPDILFLDEPTSGVDPLARRQFWHQINTLAEHGVTILVTTHFMDEAEYCDRLAIMAAGKILKIGVPDEIREFGRTENNPEPTFEDAFIHLIEESQPDRKAL